MKSSNARRVKANTFGALGKAYVGSRRGYPDQVFKYLKKIIFHRGARILDIGCGTGISTRQLKQKRFNVVGVDKDSGMIRYARSQSKIRYVVASADKLPFRDEEFDAVTAFTAFHWFTDKKSVNEIKRVLKRGGVFFTVSNRSAKNKRPLARSSYGRAWDKLVTGYVSDHNSFKGYFPSKVLQKYGFVGIHKQHFFYSDKYTPEKMVLLNKSLSYWNLVPNSKRIELERKLLELYRARAVRGYITRYRDAEVVSGVLPNSDKLGT